MLKYIGKYNVTLIYQTSQKQFCLGWSGPILHQLYRYKYVINTPFHCKSIHNYHKNTYLIGKKEVGQIWLKFQLTKIFKSFVFYCCYWRLTTFSTDYKLSRLFFRPAILFTDKVLNFVNDVPPWCIGNRVFQYCLSVLWVWIFSLFSLFTSPAYSVFDKHHF